MFHSAILNSIIINGISFYLFLRLNKNGEIFYSHIQPALKHIVVGQEQVASSQGEALGNINMLIRTKKSIVNKKIMEFIKKNKNISFHLTHNYAAVNFQDYDIIIDEQSNQYQGYSLKPIVKEKIKIAASKASPLCNRQLILNDLRHLPFITMSQGSSLYKITKEVCQRAGFSPNIVIESDDNQDIKTYMEEDFGIAFVSEKFFINGPGDNLCFLNVVDFDYNRITYIYLSTAANVSKAAKHFFDYMEEIS